MTNTAPSASVAVTTAPGVTLENVTVRPCELVVVTSVALVGSAVDGVNVSTGDVVTCPFSVTMAAGIVLVDTTVSPAEFVVVTGVSMLTVGVATAEVRNVVPSPWLFVVVTSIGMTTSVADVVGVESGVELGGGAGVSLVVDVVVAGIVSLLFCLLRRCSAASANTLVAVPGSSL